MKEPKQLPHQKEGFDGYSLEQLRYMRAYEAARIEIARNRLSQSLDGLRHNAVVESGWIGKVIGSFSYAEAALIAFKFCRKIFRTFRKKK